MNRIAEIIVPVLAVLLAVFIPLVVAILVSSDRGEELIEKQALSYAREVLVRAEMVADQVTSGLSELVTADQNATCSEANISLMRRIAMSSIYIKAVGRVDGNHMVCSSLEGSDVPFDLGEPALVSPSGVIARGDVQLPIAEDMSFVVLQSGDYALILHKEHPIDTGEVEEGVILAAITRTKAWTFASNGDVPAEWISFLGESDRAVEVTSNYVISLIASDRYDLVGIAAIPIGELDTLVDHIANVAIPIGIVASTILIAIIFYFRRRHSELPAVIRSALKRDEFFLEYQPIIDTDSGKWVGAEALLRWQRRNGERIRPDIFIPAAEEAGMIQGVTDRVLELVRRDVGPFFKFHPDFYISINLSSADLHDVQTATKFQNLSTEIGAADGNLIVEATETSFTMPDKARETIKQLRNLGISIAIDDFGTGYSSLSSLKNLDVQYLKIDKSFVDSVTREAVTSKVVLHIVDLAKTLNLEIIAEGVESEDQVKVLKSLGVRFFQGWYFAEPQSLDQLRLNI